jgi:dTMP kinase
MYLAFEGADGTGKSTAAKKLYEFMKKNLKGTPVYLLQSPGGTELGKKIREIVKHDPKIAKRAAFHMFAADYFQFLEEHKTKLHEASLGRAMIIQDRCTPVSAYPYQVFLNGMSYDLYRAVYGRLSYVPDIVLLFDAPAYTINERIQKRQPSLKKKHDNYEGRDKQEVVLEGYRRVKYMSTIPETSFARIDANESPMSVKAQCVQVVCRKKWVELRHTHIASVVAEMLKIKL